nr:hypothetical protein [Tanacetum cinerariifolium]
MGRDTVQLETAVTTISQEYLLEFTSEYGISEALYPKLPGPEDRIVDFPEGKARPRVDVFQQEARKKYPSMLYQALRFPKKLEQPLLLGRREDVLDYCRLAYKCSEGRDASQEYVFPKGCDDTEHTSYPNPETTRSTTLLSRVEPQILPRRRGVIEMKDPAAATDSSGIPSTIERSPLDFANENPSLQSTEPEDQEAAAPEVPPLENVTTTGAAPEAVQTERVAATSPPVVKERRKRGHDRVDTNAPPKVLRRDHADPRPTESTREGKSLAAIELRMGSTRPVPASQGATVDVSDPNPQSIADPQSHLPRELLRPEIQSQRIHRLPPWSGLLKAYIGLNRLRLRFEQEAKLLKKSVAQVTRQDKRIRAKENEIKNLETLLEAETDMKKAAENKSAELSKELENMRALFSDLQVSNNRLSQQVSTLQEQVMGEEKLKAAFEEFKQYEDNRRSHVSRWVIGRGLRLAVMKCGESTELRKAFTDVVSAGIAKGMSEGLKHVVEHEKAKLDLESIEAYDLKAEAKYIAALHALKNLNDTGDDAPQWIRELRPSSSQLTIPVYPEACDPMDPWACKEEILLADAIAANVSRAEKKKKCRVVCRTYGIGFPHHARSNDVSVSVPTVPP